MSTNSLLNLYNELKSDFNLSYILTSKLNQDSLENLFSLIRGSGGCNDHPKPMEFLYRMRLLVLGKNENVRKNCNTRQTNDEFIVGRVLEATKVQGGKVANSSTLDKETEIDSETERDGDLISESELALRSTTEAKATPTIRDQITSDGLCYISGWMARKLKSKYSHLGGYMN